MKNRTLQVKGESRRGWSDEGGDELHLLKPTLRADQIEVHRHATAHLVLVLQGRYEHAAGAPSEGPLLLINPPRTEHHDRFAAGQRLGDARFMALGISPQRWWAWQQLADLPDRPVAISGAEALIAAQRWHEALDEGPQALDDCIAAALGARDTRDTREPRLRSTSAWLLRARRHLREHVMEGRGPLQLSRLAADLGVHPVSLTRAFQARWGCSPLQMAQALRLDHAAALLRGKRRVAEVAAHCGFHDQAHLARSFRAAYGLSPRAWREA